MIQHFNIICEDLLRAEPTDAEISPPPYVEGIRFEKSEVLLSID